jgi:peroxiredoxin
MQPGAKLPVFQLKGTDNQFHNVGKNKIKKGTLILFLCNHCPYVHAYAWRIKQIIQKFAGSGLEIYGINANDPVRYPADSFESMPEMAELTGLKGHYLWDGTQEIARKFKAERTPEAYLFNSANILVYRGAIDDDHSDKNISEKYLENAIISVVNNDVIQQNYVVPVGCSIKWKINGK